MLRGILLFCLCLSCASTKANVEESAWSVSPRVIPLTPEDSHFWCGEHCSIQAGCEEVLICGCYQISTSEQDGAVQSLMTEEEATKKLVKGVRTARAKYGFPASADETILREPHEIRQVYGAFNNDVWLCGVFVRYVRN